MKRVYGKLHEDDLTNGIFFAKDSATLALFQVSEITEDEYGNIRYEVAPGSLIMSTNVKEVFKTSDWCVRNLDEDVHIRPGKREVFHIKYTTKHPAAAELLLIYTAHNLI